MIQRVDLNGFKSFGDTNIELRPLTLLSGLNSSGKSTVIQAIEMAETYRRTNGRTFLLSRHGNAKELTNDAYGAVYELRVREPKEIRIYFQFVDNEYHVLSMGWKGIDQNADIGQAFERIRQLRQI